MIIEDATGNKIGAKVDDENRLRTFSVIEPEDKHLNKDGKVWSLNVSVTPVGVDDVFFYLKNTGTKKLAVTDIRAKSSVVTDICLHSMTGTPTFTASSDVVPISRNLGSSAIPTATIKQDTDITGLVEVGELFFMSLDTVDKMFHLSTSSNIIIPQGGIFALQRKAATGLIKAVVSLVEMSDD